ncbi:STAS domain-containing protein [bacterium]|nr:STAS domain-containing protein [bacterium]
MKEFRIDCENRDEIRLVKLTGSLDMYSFPRLESQLSALFEEGHHRVVLDCRELDYIGSAGLGALIGFAKQAREQGGDVKLLNVPERIYKIIELLGFTKVLQVHDTEEKALGSFAGA